MPSGASSNLCCLFLQTRTETRRRPTPRRRCDALHLAHRCQWRFLPEEFGPWTRVWSQFRRWSKNGTWSRVLTALHASSRTALGRKAPRPRWSLSTRTSLAGFERRCDLSQPGRPLRSDQRRQTDRLRRRHGPATLRASRPRCDLRGQCRRTDTRRPRPLGADERLELVLVDRGTAQSAASDSRTNSTTKFAEWDGTSPRNEHGAKVFRPSVTLARRGGHGHLVRRRRLARCFENTVTSAPVVARCLNR